MITQDKLNRIVFCTNKLLDDFCSSVNEKNNNQTSDMIVRKLNRKNDKQKIIGISKFVAHYYEDCYQANGFNSTTGEGDDVDFEGTNFEFKNSSSITKGYSDSWLGNSYDNKTCSYFVFITYDINKTTGKINKIGALIYFNGQYPLEVSNAGTKTGFKSYKIKSQAVGCVHEVRGKINFSEKYVKLYPEWINKTEELDNIDNMSNNEIENLLGINLKAKKKLPIEKEYGI
jgi:hypothetical protein